MTNSQYAAATDALLGFAFFAVGAAAEKEAESMRDTATKEEENFMLRQVMSVFRKRVAVERMCDA